MLSHSVQRTATPATQLGLPLVLTSREPKASSCGRRSASWASCSDSAWHFLACTLSRPGWCDWAAATKPSSGGKGRLLTNNRVLGRTCRCALTLRASAARSEERRVGKEGRSRWSPYH